VDHCYLIGVPNVSFQKRMYRSCWTNRSFSEDNGEVGADAVAFIAHSSKMRDALGIVMRAPLVFLPAGSSPKERLRCFRRRKGFDLISRKFFGDDKPRHLRSEHLDRIRGSRDYEFICVSFLSTVPFSEGSSPFERTDSRRAESLFFIFSGSILYIHDLR